MTDDHVDELITRALDHRGFVTLRKRDGSKVVGFLYNRAPEHIELFDEQAVRRIRLPIDEVSDIELSGEDTAATAHRIWERRHRTLEISQPDERPILVVVALPRELRGVARAIGGKLNGVHVSGWLGEHRAIGIAVGIAGEVSHAVVAYRPRLVISCGFCGALDPWLRPGHIVVASSVRDERGESIPVAGPDLAVIRGAFDGWQGVAEGEILCTQQVVTTRDHKRALAQRGRLAVDLETWSAARAAREAGAPWLAIRAVIDPIDDDLPAFTRDPRSSYVLPALLHVLRGGVLDLARLGVRARMAERSLERALVRIAPVVGSLRPAEVEL
jgi:adenosylhomocysteine nucleosidase